jgi:predicted secreted protein
MRKLMLGTALGLGLVSSAFAGPLVDLSAEASLPAVNDMARATLYSEASGSNPAELARRVNGDIAEALKVAKASSAVTVKSGQQSTWPVYAQGTRIETWRMRSEIVVEAKDPAAMSDLIGKLQQMKLAVGNVAMMPSPEMRRKVTDEAVREAIRDFQKRAELVAGQIGQPWRIRKMSVNQSSGPTPVPVMRAARGMAMAEAAPAPIEAGDSLITATVTGQIELGEPSAETASGSKDNAGESVK